MGPSRYAHCYHSAPASLAFTVVWNAGSGPATFFAGWEEHVPADAVRHSLFAMSEEMREGNVERLVSTEQHRSYC